MTEELGGQATSGSIHRRALIKGAAVAGVAAWTAPVILDSLVSPAAALSFVGCRKINISVVVDLDLTCNPFPTSSTAWATTCDATFPSTVGSTCGSTISGVTAALDTLADLGITRTACGFADSTLTLSKTNCTWVAGEAHSTLTGCTAPTINNTTAGARTITWPVGLSVNNYYVVINCT